jgi:hypothetical protein
MEPGGVYAMNLHYHHSVINESSEDRMHMIIARHDALDGWKQLIEDAAVKQGITGEYKVIDELP